MNKDLRTQEKGKMHDKSKDKKRQIGSNVGEATSITLVNSMNSTAII